MADEAKQESPAVPLQKTDRAAIPPVPARVALPPDAKTERAAPVRIVPSAAAPVPRPPTIKTTAPARPSVAMALPIEPKEETDRVSLLPDAAKPPDMTKTQPLLPVRPKPLPPMPAAPARIAVTTRKSVADAIPLPLCWAVLAISALVLLVEIWNYIS